MQTPQGKYRIMTFRNFVPHQLRFVILLSAAILFQFSNSIYLTNLNEVVSGKALTSEDIRLISSASFIGMTMIFPLLFRIKFRFTSRTILLTASSVIITGNIIGIYSDNVLILLVSSLVVGMARMIGMFECMSSIQLILTPKRDFTVFFPIVYLIVLGSIQFSGLLTAEISYLYSWKYMYTLVIGLQLLFLITIFFLMRPVRLMKKFPLYQVDWLGMGLWIIVLLLLNFIFEYGKRLDWFDSEYICIATIACIIFLICAIQRMNGLRRPYIMPEAFKYKNVIVALIMLVFMQLFISTSNVIMNTYTGGILGYDILHNTSLNWAVFTGILTGFMFSFYWMSIYRGGYKTIIFIGFLSLVLFHFILYFVFQPGINKEALYLPYAIRGFGYIALYISIALYAWERIPFPHFFATLSIIGVIRSAAGSTIANSVCTNLLSYLYKRNLIILSGEIDWVNPTSNIVYNQVFNLSITTGQSIEQATTSAISALYGNVNMQSILLSWKEVFGGIILLGILVLLGILLTNYIKPSFRQFPKIRNIWRYMRGKAYSGK